jgi:hypothetical protein
MPKPMSYEEFYAHIQMAIDLEQLNLLQHNIYVRIGAALKNREELLEACRTVEPWVILAMARDPYITHPTSLIHAENDLKLLRKAIKNAEGTP